MSAQTSPLITFWFQPASSTRALIESGRGHSAALGIAALFGAVQSGTAYLRAEQPSAAIFVYGALAGVVVLYFLSFFFRVSGKLFKGDPKPENVRRSIGLGLLPWTLVFAFVFGYTFQGGDPNLLAKWFPALFVPFLYGYTLLLLSLSVSLGLNLWKTFFCIALTFIGSLFPLTLIAQLILGTPGAGN